MKVVCALDSFKGSLDSFAAGQAARAGVIAAAPAAQVVVLPVADGGEGTLAALMSAQTADPIDVVTTNAAHTPLTAQYGRFERDGWRVAVLECARVIGIDLVAVNEALPPVASTYGFGILLREALARGCDELLITLGGSATTDGGSGLFQALGARVLDPAGEEIPTTENPLWRFASLDVSGMVRPNVQLTVLSDVTNPLIGPNGAAAVFGPQKGATPQQVAHLDAQLRRWARCLHHELGVSVAEHPGAGAAGGLGAACLALGGQIVPGFARVAHEVGLAAALRGANLVITGEGSLDAQSAAGKVPAGVARMGRASGALVVGIAGRVQRPLAEMDDLLDASFAIHSQLRSMDEAMDPTVTAAAIRDTSYQIARLVVGAQRSPRQD